MSDFIGSVTTPTTGSVTDGAGSVTAIGDGVNPALKVSVVQNHLTDGQTIGGAVQAIQTNDVQSLFNGSSFDRARGNVDLGAVLSVAAATTAQNSGDLTNFNGRGAQIGIDVTALTGTSCTVVVQGKDVASGQYYTLLSSAPITAPGFTVLTVYPGAATAANASSPQVLPRTFRVLLTPTSATVTATIGVSVIV
jgi:hypothetical protein